MKTSVEPLEGNKVKVSVEVDEIEFDKALDAAFRRIAREVRIPGLRPVVRAGTPLHLELTISSRLELACG